MFTKVWIAQSMAMDTVATGGLAQALVFATAPPGPAHP